MSCTLWVRVLTCFRERPLMPNAASFSQTWDSCSNGGADPLVRAGRPRPALLSKNQALPEAGRPARGPAADEGVRPTTYAGARLWENLAALGFSPPSRERCETCGRRARGSQKPNAKANSL